MAASDYYNVLGVSKSATDDEIRRAYKKMVRENHPDAKPDDKAAAERFKQAQEAYAVLGDSEKRQQYDQYGPGFFEGGGPRGQQRTWSTGAGGGGAVDLNDLFGGQFDFGDIFSGGGRTSGFGGGRRQPTSQKGNDLKFETTVPFQVAAEGGQHELQLNRDNKSERINVKIPAGINDGSIIRLSGQGEPGYGGGPSGDLLLTVKTAAHPFFRRDRNHLLIDVPITPTEAILGSKIEVPTLSEGNVVVTVPPETSTGTKLRLKEKGIVDQKSKQRGDLLAVLKIVVPDQITPEMRTHYEQLAKLDASNPRAKLWSLG